MNTEYFNIEQGIYLTVLHQLKTALHSHPACEIVYAVEGSFNLQVNETIFNNIPFAIMQSNVLHSITFDKSIIKILMVEHRDIALHQLFSTYKMDFMNGCYIPSHQPGTNVFNELYRKIINLPLYSEYDTRVIQCLDIMHHQEVSYDNLKESLKLQINISESRLSHLFKENMGVSIKRYFVWHKLKQAVDQHLHNDHKLYNALLNAGFYDQAHFNKIYKSLIGTSPSKTYHSNIVQK